MQSVPGGKVNILGGHSIGHSKKNIYMNVCPILNGFRYLARSIFLPSRRSAPLSEECESVWSVSWLLWLLLIGPVILDDCMTGQNYLEFLQNEFPNN
jgi:hypothetical protein